MKCSQRKRQANRLNASKSTGPRTDEGKARAGHNAVKHGLTATSPVVLDEDPAVFEAFAREMTDDLQPHGAMQRALVERIVFIAWKLRRVPEVEAKLFEAIETQVYHARVDERGMRLPAKVSEVIAEAGCQAYFGRLQMYEMRLERSLHAGLRQLERLQEMQNEASREEEPVAEAVEEPSVQNEATAPEEQTLSHDVDDSSVLERSDTPKVLTDPIVPRGSTSSMTRRATALAG